MKIISVRKQPEYTDKAIRYFQNSWSFVSPVIYEDSIKHSLTSDNPLPQWYLLEKEDELIGCAGLITNDFISRMDLYPWLCALYIDENHWGNSYATLLIERAKKDCRKAGFKNMYLCTEHIGYYEKYGFTYIGQGYHPWEEESRIYKIKIEEKFDFSIRPETEKDWNEIYNLIQTAFKTAKVKDGDEQDFAVGLKNSENYIPELGLVAEKDGNLIGHIMLTKTLVEQPNGDKFKALLLAPISVLIEYRDFGVGSALIQESFRIAKELGYTAVFLCGDPNYYNRFGFKQNSLYGIKSKAEIPEQFTLVCELVPNALEGIHGTVECY